MQFRVISAFVVFLGSYLPLSLILLAQDFEYAFLGRPLCWKVWESACSIPLKNPVFAVGIFVACLICFALTLWALAVVKPKDEIVVQEAKHVPTDLMNYTLPYVVSFMSIDYQDIGKHIGVLIFLGWMFWISYKSGQIILNPVLIVFGWKLYDISYNHAASKQVHSANVLAHGNIKPGARYRQIPVQDILVIKSSTGED
ncbi:hypothetical protein NKJ09_17775 [Mesorhizobium sp. M0189]|uniref:hypothetical protein n=2 Tax=unclassified Mesorhizobium TaxID=325217 RepID=UPI00333832CE